LKTQDVKTSDVSIFNDRSQRAREREDAELVAQTHRRIERLEFEVIGAKHQYLGARSFTFLRSVSMQGPLPDPWKDALQQVAPARP
jgi:hypothetical protein